ncbi:DoxX family protein [Cohnella abietis]|uniref:DoxX family protein n=1 Tax=Cohnella abietis TaxID=2507935 RepID=A0A3T1D6V1_9BACL|nr:DoxX family protein [Cohnella abietis]BBI33807.1 hypothetical protein KCTCHS21_32060 [Cohnella abietis]
MDVLSIIFQVILGLGFLLFGLAKFGSKKLVEEFKHYGYPSWFRVFTGLLELVSAVLVIAGIWNKTLAAWGALLIAVTMLGAIFTHVKMKEPSNKQLMPFILLVIAVVIIVNNFDFLLG